MYGWIFAGMDGLTYGWMMLALNGSFAKIDNCKDRQHWFACGLMDPSENRQL